MIIFFNKSTGEITGTVDGRIHHEDHLKMWVGDKSENDRIVIQWHPIRFYDKNGNAVGKGSPKVFTADFEPDHIQKELIEAIDQRQEKLENYKIDLDSKTLVKK